MEAASKSCDNLPKEVRDTLEREADLREQLRFTEADLLRTRQRMNVNKEKGFFAWKFGAFLYSEKRFQELEHENDELLQRYTRLAERHSEAQSSKQPSPVLTMSTSMLLPTPQKPSTMLRSIRSENLEKFSWKP